MIVWREQLAPLVVDLYIHKKKKNSVERFNSAIFSISSKKALMHSETLFQSPLLGASVHIPDLRGLQIILLPR